MLKKTKQNKKHNETDFGTLKPLKRDIDRFKKLTVRKHGGIIYEWFTKILDVYEKFEKEKK